MSSPGRCQKNNVIWKIPVEIQLLFRHNIESVNFGYVLHSCLFDSVNTKVHEEVFYLSFHGYLYMVCILEQLIPFIKMTDEDLMHLKRTTETLKSNAHD